MAEVESQQRYTKFGNADRGCDEKSEKAEQIKKC